MFHRGPVRTRKLPAREQANGDSDERDDEHDQALGLRRRHEPVDPLVHDQPGKYEQRGAVRLSREDLRPLETEGQVADRWSSHQPDDDQ